MASDLFQTRALSAEELEVPLPLSVTIEQLPDTAAKSLEDDDPFLVKVRRALHDYGGVILSGVPGTSKSWWAARIAEHITSDESHREYVQFHASYQYEDFMYGYVPNETSTEASSDVTAPDGQPAGEVARGGGFRGRKAIFLDMCERAERNPNDSYVLVIDEFSRADVGRVFGEALTYIEDTKRGKSFKIAAGLSVSVPKNLLIIATMNPFDRGVDEVDAAFERRFAKLTMEPSVEELRRSVEHLGEPVKNRLTQWFRYMNGLSDTPLAAIGHAYFKRVEDIASLRELWDYQLRYHVDRAFRLNPQGGTEARDKWKNIFRDVAGGWDGLTEVADTGSTVELVDAESA